MRSCEPGRLACPLPPRHARGAGASRGLLPRHLYYANRAVGKSSSQAPLVGNLLFCAGLTALIKIASNSAR
jgi:hypothetical protein